MTKTKQFTLEDRFAILNPSKHLWSSNIFETCEKAEQYKRDFEQRNPAVRLDKNKVVPVRVTIELL